MERRTFLRMTTVAAGTAFVVPRAFGALAPSRHPHEPDVASELEVARALGKPLLVLVRPRPRPQKTRYERLWERQHAFGAWLRHGDAPSMAMLAMCHVTCAPIREVLDAVPDFERPSRDPWLVLVEAGTQGPRWRMNVADMPATPPEPARPEEELLFTYSDAYKLRLDRHAEEALRIQLTQLDVWLSELLGPARLSGRAAEALASLDDEQRARHERALGAPTSADRELLWRAAAATLHHAKASGAGEGLVEMLVAESTRRLGRHAPRGAHWGTSGGCASRVSCDQPEPSRYNSGFDLGGCGMGYTPEVSRHFLQLLVEH